MCLDNTNSYEYNFWIDRDGDAGADLKGYANDHDIHAKIISKCIVQNMCVLARAQFNIALCANIRPLRIHLAYTPFSQINKNVFHTLPVIPSEIITLLM